MDTRQFESLGPEEQAKVFHQSSFKERAELLRHSHDPLALTRSLSGEELYLLTREMDMEERSEVIRYATLPQLFFIADVDCWKKDRIHPDHFVEWLETLLAADEKILLNWLVQMDYETVVAGFQKVVQVLKPEREYAADEALGDTPYFTLDDMYYICVPEENFETIRRALSILFENHRGRYVSLLEDLMADIQDQVEEDAYQNRGMRLAERGFPDDETARKIYRPVSREEFESFPLKKNNGTHEKAPAPHYPVLWSADRLFLDDVLLRIRKDPAGVLESLHDELAWISNKVIACGGIDFSSEEKVRKGIERARFFVSIGLEELSGGDPEKARALLEERWCEIIFRRGVTVILELKERVHAVLRDYWKGEKIRLLEFLMPPYDFVAQGLLRQVPQCYDPGVQEGAEPLRDFKELQDVEQCGKSVEQIEKIHETLNREFPKIWRGGNSVLALLGTLFAEFVLKGKPAIAALRNSQITEFAAKAFEGGPAGRRIRPGLKEIFLEKLYGAEEREVLRIPWAFVFDEIEEQLGKLDFSKPPDPRFISCLWILSKKS